ncbi:MAG: ABC transporter permease [Brooklawnia sp.]|uniref:ABC transporter permease n=1 Tax=Brooklawnia sp. TaxID=2699740 RepID=UPI003C77DA41
MNTLTPFNALLRNELRLLSRESAPVAWAVVLPLTAAVVTPVVPAVATPRPYLDSMSFAQVYQPVLLLFTSSVLALQVLPTIVTQYREFGVLRRLRTTPVAPWTLLAAVVTMVLGLSVAMGVLLVGGATAAGLPLPTNLPAFIAAFLLAELAFLALGAMVCTLAPNPRVGGQVGGFIAACMWFASGMWLPRPLFPPVFGAIMDATPGGAAAGAMLGSLDGSWPTLMQTGVLVGWALIGFAVAARTFKFEVR